MSERRDVFDEIFSLLTPERLLHDPRRTGKASSFASLTAESRRRCWKSDAASEADIIEPIEGGMFTADRTEPLPYDGHQSTPHGTTVADIILTLAPRIEPVFRRCLWARGSCEVEAVIHALHWAINVWNCKIVNLSLGVPESRLVQLNRRQQLLGAIEEGYYNDVLIFAAAHNEHPLTRSYPASFAPSLLSVDKRLFEDPLQFAYHLQDQVEFQAHGKGYLGPFASEPATSWAAPHLAGIGARLLSLRPGLKPFEIKTLLYWLFQRSAKSGTGL